MKRLFQYIIRGSFPILCTILTTCAEKISEEPYIGRLPLSFHISEKKAWTETACKSSSEVEKREGMLQSISSFKIQPDSKALYLHTYISDLSKQSYIQAEKSDNRGMPINGQSFYNSINVSASILPKNSTSTEYELNYILNEEVKKESDWTLDDYLYPGKEHSLKFFAFAPYQPSGIDISQKFRNEQIIKYTVPENIEDQSDLLVSVSEKIDGKGQNRIPLEFTHALSAIQIIMSESTLPGKITGITLKGVYAKGDYDMNLEKWVNHMTVRNYSQDLDIDINGKNSQILNPDKLTFMMIPQILPKDAELIINFRHNLTGDEHLLTASIGETEWSIGKMTTYRVSLKSIVVESVFKITGLNGSDSEFGISETSNEGEYSVTSFARIIKSGEEEKCLNLPWKTSFSIDNGQTYTQKSPEWIASFTSEGPGSTEKTTYPILLTERRKSCNEALKDNPPKTEPYNLSNSTGADIIENTANCYIINTAGTYRIPLVYGNAIKDAQPNESSYKQNNTRDKCIPNFRTHRNSEIVSPFIEANNPDSENLEACLIWQDSDNILINSIKLISGNDCSFIEFSIDQTSISQGNAIIAVREHNNSGNIILWSWHIWITPYVLGTNLTSVEGQTLITSNGAKVTSDFLPFPLGFCAEEGGEVWMGRTLKVKFEQDASSLNKEAEEKILELNLKTHMSQKTENGSFVKGSATYYQWGRKDPFPPFFNGSKKTLKYQYTEYEVQLHDCYSSGLYEKHKTSGLLASFPHLFLQYPVTGIWKISWTGDYYKNYWNVSPDRIYYHSLNNYKYPVKSIYDPSPCGFVIMPCGSFGESTSNEAMKAQINKVLWFVGGWIDPDFNYKDFDDYRMYWTSDAYYSNIHITYYEYQSNSIYLYYGNGNDSQWSNNYNGYIIWGSNIVPLKQK